MNSQIRNVLFTVVAAMSLSFLPGCGGDASEPATKTAKEADDKVGEKTDVAKADTSTQDTETQDPPPVSIDLTQSSFMADDLVAAYDTDPAAFLQAMGGRTVEISGIVSDVGHELDQETPDGVLTKLGAPFVKLAAGLKCLTKDEKPWSQIWLDDLVVVKGRMSEFELVVFDCEVSLVGESSVTSLAAASLAAEFLLDADRAVDAYDGWPLRVTGDVLEFSTDADGVTRVLLKGQDNIRIGCVFTVFEFHRLAELEVGDELTVIGNFSGFLPEPGIIQLSYCQPVRIAK